MKPVTMRTEKTKSRDWTTSAEGNDQNLQAEIGQRALGAYTCSSNENQHM
jgi:hypothetical protein